MALKLIQPWFSVVIPTWGKGGVALTAECLRSLRQTHSQVSPEVIVVDDGSDEATVAELNQVCESHQARLIHQSQNGGFAKACNAGLRQATGLSCVLVNNDIVFQGCPTLQILCDSLNILGAGVVGTRLLYPDDTVQHGGVVFVPAQGQPIPGYWDHALRGYPRDHPMAVSIRPMLVSGALYAISRAAMLIVGLLDERFGMAVEDIDYGLDCMVAGLPIFYNGYAWAYHLEGRTRGRTLEEKMQMAPEKWETEQEGLKIFFKKWVTTDWTDFAVRLT